MKTMLNKSGMIVFIVLCSLTANAQFTSATLQASGLTCAMCSKAINNALAALPFIKSVKADISNSAFLIAFKQGAKMDIDQLRKAVEDAGFSVARLKLSAHFKNLAIRNDEHVQLNGSAFHFLNVRNQTLNGEREIVLVDKNFVHSKEFKKYSTTSQMKCVQTGRAAACCSKEGLTPNTRIYHVTI